MQIKQLIFSMIAFVVIILTSCSKEQDGVEVNGTQTFTFNLAMDGQTQTRAAAPVVAGYKLKYYLQVLDASGNAIPEAATETETGQFDVSLPLGAAYTCLFWAHYIPDAGGENEFFDVTDLKAVTLKKHLTAEDQCQAFSATADITADQTGATQTVMLRRAVSQVNLKNTGSMKLFGKLEAKYTISANTFNVQTGEVAATGSVTGATTFTVTDFTTATAGADGNFTYQSAYFLSSQDGTGSMLNLEAKTYNKTDLTAPLQTLAVNNVPTKRNYKTNVIVSFDPLGATYTYTFDFAEWETDELIIKSIDVWDGTIPTGNAAGSPFDGGTGAAGDPYIIVSAASLAQLAADVNVGQKYTGKYFQLNVDIDLNNKPWTPIGWEPKLSIQPIFAGHFDGMHHTVSNLNLSLIRIDETFPHPAGFFGKIENSSITGLHVEGKVEYTASGNNIIFTGGLVGEFRGGTLKDCSFVGTVKGPRATGGLAGFLNGNLDTDVWVIASKFSGTVDGGRNVGGIAGEICGGAIAGCYADATLIMDELYRKGGIVGSGSYVTISGCYSVGCDLVDATVLSDVTFATPCYSTGSMSGTNLNQFSSSVWPDGSTVGDAWYADPSNDGTHTRNDRNFTNCKFWKSIGSWNGGTPIYPKLWWEK